ETHLEKQGIKPAKKKLMETQIQNQVGHIDLPIKSQQNALIPRISESLSRLLRLAIVFASRRRDDRLPAVRLLADYDNLTVMLPSGWLQAHTLRAELLQQEAR
ncbi:guanosine-5'-triphosphate,3'-diphosphate pyrophosphatase, partial [Erwinia amylovora]|nr:guanosine-5'-triphosphate,3'-diphosphate pyrophosphatase [Erwinia amylovora]